MAKKIGACQVTLKNINALAQKNHTREMLKKKCILRIPPPPTITFLKVGPLTVQKFMINVRY